MSLTPFIPSWFRFLAQSVALLLASQVYAQNLPPSALKTNEVLIKIKLFILSVASPGPSSDPTGETVRYQNDSTLDIDGTFAGQLIVTGQGKRSLSQFRRLQEGLTGSFEEHATVTRLGLFGEGGLDQTYREVNKEDWWFPHIDLTPPIVDLEVDLQSSTWTCPRFASFVDSLLKEATAFFNYTGIRSAPDENYVQRTWVSGDSDRPPPDMRGGNPRQSAAARDSLARSFAEMEEPQPLDNSDALYAGSIRRVVGNKDSYQAAFTFTWSVYATVPELELRVTSPDLDQWRPQAEPRTVGDTRANPGKPLRLMAEVVNPSGAKPVVRLRKLHWWLEETSRLPGFAMNAPYDSSETAPDLEIDHPRATAEGQELELTELTTLRSEIRIKPYDWGGWSTLHVEAELDDGRKLTGRLKGQTGDETAIRLPSRDPDSKVANSWKRRIHAVGLADDADGDNFPEGRRNGDGFTVFEEYRGFYASELDASGKGLEPAHHSTNPRGKTVFVYDRIDNTHTWAARSLFEAASQARVFVVVPGYGLLDESRTMNRNVGNAPSKGPQHAIGIGLGAEFGPKFPGSPSTAQVTITSFPKVNRTFSSLHPAPVLQLYRREIASRLLMACRVDRPGTGDEVVGFKMSRDDNGFPRVITHSGKRVTLRDEATGIDLAERLLPAYEAEAQIVADRSRSEAQTEFSSSLYTGRRGGQHSGPLDNIMRSAVAEAYFLDGTDTIVVLSVPPAQKLGYALTDTAEGDEYNARDYDRPRTRFSDGINPPSRRMFDVSDHTP